MTNPTRPLAGTDLAPCAACGTPMQSSACKPGGLFRKQPGKLQGDLFLVECPNCYRGVGVGSLDGLTLAGSPSTRALWTEVERLRLELAELRLALAAEQGRQEGAPSEGWEYQDRQWVKFGGSLGPVVARRLFDGAEARYSFWDRFIEAPNMRAAMQAADAAEAAAKGSVLARRPIPLPVPPPMPSALDEDLYPSDWDSNE